MEESSSLKMQPGSSAIQLYCNGFLSEVWIYVWQTPYGFWLSPQIPTPQNTYAHPNIYLMSLQKKYHPVAHRSSMLSQGTHMASIMLLSSVINRQGRTP